MMVIEHCLYNTEHVHLVLVGHLVKDIGDYASSDVSDHVVAFVELVVSETV